MHAQAAGSMEALSGAATAPLPLPGEDQARADLYALIARLLLAAPDASLLADLAAADPIRAGDSGNPFEDAWHKLTLAAAITEADAVADEFDALFISIGTPRQNPYESRYLSGFINDIPLASLRADLATLGLARAAGARDFEDHLGAMCETMRVLIVGGAGLARQPVARQKWFYERHIAPWSARCLADIANDPAASFYRVVAGFAHAFLAIEAEAFAFEESIDD